VHGPNEPRARKLLATAWCEPAFISSYARWTVDILEQQRPLPLPHREQAPRPAHRVHIVNTTSIALTALARCCISFFHAVAVAGDDVLPALGASLHGALAQSEAYRPRHDVERLVAELQGAIDRIRAALHSVDPPRDVNALKAAIEAAVALILEEHQTASAGPAAQSAAGVMLGARLTNDRRREGDH